MRSYNALCIHAVLCGALLVGCAVEDAAAPASGASLYSGAAADYDGYARSSQYVTVRDGTRIAVDIFQPTTAGRSTTARLPVLFMQTQYRRAWLDALGDESYLPDVLGGYLELVKAGYVVVCADARGEGASF